MKTLDPHTNTSERLLSQPSLINSGRGLGVVSVCRRIIILWTRKNDHFINDI